MNEPLTQKQKQENRIVERVVERIKALVLTQESTPVKPIDLSKFVRFMESARLIAASALLAAVFTALYEYLALMGVADVSPARLVLGAAWFFAVLFVWEVASTFSVRNRLKAGMLAGLALVLAVLCVGLDRWTIRWRISHPPVLETVALELQGITGDIQQLTTSKIAVPHLTNDQSGIREIRPVPGFLNVEYRYAHLPLERANDKSIMNVFFFNRGSTYTHDSTTKGGLYYVDFNGRVPPLSDPAVRDSFRELMAKVPPPATQDVGPGQAIWNTYETSVITPKMFSDIQAETARIYFVAHTEWITGGVPDHVDTCIWLQPSSWASRNGVAIDPKKMDPIWRGC